MMMGRRGDLRQAIGVGALVALGVSMCGCAGGRRRPAVEPAAEVPEKPAPVEESVPRGVFHQVRPGQTLWRIARAYGVSVDELAKVNGIPDPSRIEVGRTVFVPGAEERLDVAPYPAPAPPGGHVAGTAPPVGATFLWPVHGEILSRFGTPRRTHRHAGVDIRGRLGQKVLAARAGRVVFSGSMRGYGKVVVVSHGDGYRTLYAHNSRLLVSAGEHVERGQAVALLGRTGNATTEHCHFEIRYHRVPVDPLPLLSGAEEASRR